MQRRTEAVDEACLQWTPDGLPRLDDDGNQLMALPMDSLVGSWVCPIGDDGPSGRIVNEPQAGFYLLDVQDFNTGETEYQRVVPLAFFVATPDEELEYRFYETREQMREAWLAHRGITTELVNVDRPGNLVKE
jgi:hypothetical protein